MGNALMADGLQETIIPGFRGVVRLAETTELEKSPPDTLFQGDNICFDNQNNAYVSLGFAAITSSLSQIQSLYYSQSVKKLLGCNSSGDFYIIDPNSGATVLLSMAAFGSNKFLTYGEWPQTGKIYISDGTKLYECDGATITDKTANGPNGAGGIICSHKNTLWIAQGKDLYPSGVGTPTTFTLINSISCGDDGGSTITALCSFNNILYVGKLGTFFAIVGDGFTGETADVQRLNLNSGRGPIHKHSIFVDENAMYFIATDGFYRIDQKGQYKISDAIVGQLKRLWYAVPSYAQISGFNPLYGPDAGFKYIYFYYTIGTASLTAELWKYSVNKNEFTRELHSDSSGNTFPGSKCSLAFDRDNSRTFISYNSKVHLLSDIETRDYTNYSGDMVTNPIDLGTRARQKTFEWLTLLNHDSDLSNNDIDFLIGLDGIYPTYSIFGLNDTLNMGTQFELPMRDLWGMFLQFRARRQGGGKLLCSQVALAYNLNQNLNRTPFQSRYEVINALYDNNSLPIKVGAITTVDSQLSYTITHGLTVTPEAVYASHKGFNLNQICSINKITLNNFVITVPSNPGAGNTIYWMAIAPSTTRLATSYCKGLVTNLEDTTVRKIGHDLNITPEAIFLARDGDSSKAITVSAVGSRQFTITPEAGISASNLFACVFKNGLPGGGAPVAMDLLFKCGLANNSPITHGLGRTPTVAMIYPNSSPIPSHQITGFTSTQLTYSGTGNYYWIVGG